MNYYDIRNKYMHTFLLSQHYSRLVCNYTIIYYVCKNIDHRTNQSKKAEALRKYNIQIKMTIFFRLFIVLRQSEVMLRNLKHLYV